MWLLDSSVKNKIEAATRAGFVPSAEQQSEYLAARGPVSAGPSPSRVLSTAGSVAEISIKGVLTQAPDFMAFLFGGGNTTYPEIIAALAESDANQEAEEIVLKVESPGGGIEGLFDTLAALEATKKPITAVVSNMAASAAYAIVSKAGSIRATNLAAQFGSIGVAVGYRVDESVIEIASSNAPNKRPDVTTAEGVAAVREELDALEEIFIESIAAGRGVSTEKVISDFGQGGMLLAKEAQKRGMIDTVGKTALHVVTSKLNNAAAQNSGGDNPETGIMDLTTLKTQHAAVYAAAALEGANKERERASAHLIAGEMSGDMKTALEAAKSGAEMTQSLQMQYMMTAANRGNIQDRAADDLDANAGDGADELDTNVRESVASAEALKQAAAACGVEIK